MAVTRDDGGTTVSVKVHATTLAPDHDHVYTFDLEGRPLTWFEEGRTYRRALDGGVHASEWGETGRRRWSLTPDEARERLAQALGAVRRVARGRLDAAARARLERIAGWTPAALLAQHEAFAAVYSPVGILPPDGYLSIVLQATFGCSWNRCTFCTFYRDRPFRVRSAEAFRRHCEDVRAFLGRGAELRRRIFLADGNALMLPDRRLGPLLDTARACFGGRPLSGFVDVFTGLRRDADGWRALARTGLARVVVGLETGDDELLEWLGKPGSREQSLEFLATLKRAGLAVSLIFMVGVGGTRHAADHVRGTLALAGRLPLARGDVIYLSPFLEHPDSPYAARAAADGVTALDDSARRKQYLWLRDGIRRAHPAVPVARYDIRRCVY